MDFFLEGKRLLLERSRKLALEEWFRQTKNEKGSLEKVFPADSFEDFLEERRKKDGTQQFIDLNMKSRETFPVRVAMERMAQASLIDVMCKVKHQKQVQERQRIDLEEELEGIDRLCVEDFTIDPGGWA